MKNIPQEIVFSMNSNIKVKYIECIKEEGEQLRDLGKLEMNNDYQQKLIENTRWVIISKRLETGFVFHFRFKIKGKQSIWNRMRSPRSSELVEVLLKPSGK